MEGVVIWNRVNGASLRLCLSKCHISRSETKHGRTRPALNAMESYDRIAQFIAMKLSEVQVVLAKRQAIDHLTLKPDPLICRGVEYIDGLATCMGDDGEDHLSKCEFIYAFTRARRTPTTDDLTKDVVNCDYVSHVLLTGMLARRYPHDIPKNCAENRLRQNWNYETIDFHIRQDLRHVSAHEVEPEKAHAAEDMLGTPGLAHCNNARLVHSAGQYKAT